MFSTLQYYILSFGGAAIYWLLPTSLRIPFLFILSLLFLATFSPFGVASMLMWALLFFYGSRIKASGPTLFYVLTVAALAQLLLFKCFPKFPSFPLWLNETKIITIVVPIGLSYFTFKLVHYLIESKRGTLPEHGLGQFLCYMFLFPIYTAGPIEQFGHFLEHRETKWLPGSTVEGLSRISYGLIKKVIVVDLLLDEKLLFGKTSSSIIENLSVHSTTEVWALLLVTYLTLYLDFSAYCDIAIGTARLFGFTIMENFNWPIFACSIVDFWRRWHMTLAGWVQQYVYMPLLGIYRKPVLALFLSFIIIGIWHELTASRIAWGLYHSAAIIIFVRWSRRGGRTNETNSGFVDRFGGIAITQIFMITSMAFLVGDRDTSLLSCFSVLAKLFYMDLL